MNQRGHDRPVSPGYSNNVRVDGRAFKDPTGRTLLLRGVNLGGSSKVPSRPSEDPREVSYVGRPFPLSDAPEHFSRLHSWGLTTIRLVIMWEAVEHRGPGNYDIEFLDYLHDLVELGGRWGLRFIVDLHQDFYSRSTGGDGAPYWTIERLGLTPDRTNEPGAPHEQPPRGPGYWPPSAARFSVNTMDTLLWAGDDFAPGLEVDGMGVQEWLQSHYVGAIKQVAIRLKDLDNVIGFDTYNEPNHGFIGVKDLRQPDFFMEFVGKHSAPLEKVPSYWDLILAASGFEPEQLTLPPNRIWADGSVDLWRSYGVWDVVDGRPELLRPDYFAEVNGEEPDFARYVAAMQRRIAEEIRQIIPDTLILQHPVVGDTRSLNLGLPGMVAQPHWYDGVVLMSKHYEPYVTYAMTGWPSPHEVRFEGREDVLANYRGWVQNLVDLASAMGGLPTLIGETGLPFDLNDKQSYKTGDFTAQETLAALMTQTLDDVLASYLIWNYTADNTNSGGDGWVNEDLSIYSPDQAREPSDINSGGRAIRQFVRPYPSATAGTPTALSFDGNTGVFEYRFVADPEIESATEVFIPSLHYPHGYDVTVDGGAFLIDPDEPRRLSIIDASGEVTVRVSRRRQG